MIHRFLLALTLPGSLMAAGLEIPYQLPRDAELSAGIFDQDGKLIRWTEQSSYRYAGKNITVWDGLDQFGKPAEPGDYKIRVVYHDPIQVEYLATANNPGTPPWPTADDKGDWLSDEANPQGVATDGTWVFLAAPGCEDGFDIIALDETGKRVWGRQIHAYPRSAALAVDGDYVYAFFSAAAITDMKKYGRVYGGDNVTGETRVVCLDKKTGRPAQFSKKDLYHKIAEWPYKGDYTYLWELRKNKSFTPAKNGGQPRYFSIDTAESTNSFGGAAAGGKLYVGMMYDNKVVEYDAATGEATGLEIPVPAPAGLYALDAQTILAVTENQVVKIDLAGKTVKSFIVTDLVAPACVTADKQGNIYVSDWADSFQVKQFDRTGKFVKAIGKPGGRPWLGPWEQDGMLLPRGLAVTGDGKLWVAEDDNLPKRVSVWNTGDGKFVKEYLGPANYGGGGHFWLDPQDRTIAYSAATRFKIDYEKNTFTPLGTVFRRREMSDAFIPHGGETQGPATKVLYRGKDEYVLIQHNRGIWTILKREGNIYNAVAAFGFRRKESNPKLTGDGAQVYQWDSDIGYHMYDDYLPDFFKGKLGHYYAWADLNGDRRAQADEMKWHPADASLKDGGVPGYDTAWGGSIGPDFALYFITGFSADGTGVFQLKPESWTAAGAPVYDVTKARLITSYPKGTAAICNPYLTRDHKLILTHATEYGKGAVSFSAIDPDTGKELWQIAMPEKLEGAGVHASGIVFDYDIPGIGPVCFTWNWHGNTRSYLFTTAGDYIGSPLADGHDGPTASWGESFRGGYQATDGTPYILNGANQALHVLRLKGLEKGAAGVVETKYQLTAAGVKQAEQLRAQQVVKKAAVSQLRVTWTTEKPPVIDGNLDDWNPGEGVVMERTKGRKAEVALRRDAEHLYLAYKVYEAGPLLRNGGADWQRLFITGDCVDFMLQTDPGNPNSRVPVAGDQRLLLGEFEGKPLAVRYRAVAPGATSPVEFMAVRFDEVVKLPGAKVAVQRNAAGGYYTVEAAVPLKDLGIDPAGTASLRGDVGVIFADESGRNRALRMYYYNHDTDLVQDLTTEATLQPHRWGALVMPLGQNLLTNGGFESPLSEDDRAGWQINGAANGGKALLSADLARSGRQSLLLTTDTPATYPEEMYKEPDYAAFRKTINDGKGDASVTVRQRIPVQPGRKYAVRLNYHTSDMQPEQKNAGRPRGFVHTGGRVEWVKGGNAVGLFSDFSAHDDWQTANNNSTWFIAVPLEAPDTATEAVISFNLRVAAEKKLPQVYLDNVEFVELAE